MSSTEKGQTQTQAQMFFPIVKYLASVFTPELNISNVSEFINLFQGASDNRFDGQLISLPMPPNAPPQVPRLILQSGQGDWKLEMSLERTSILFFRIGELEDEIISTEEFSNFCIRIFTELKKSTQTKIQRLGFVTERIRQTLGQNPSQWIVNRFGREELLEAPFNNTQSFEIHSLKKYPWKLFNNVNINSWVRIKSAELLKLRNPVVLIVNDINTLSQKEDPEASFENKDIDLFFSKAYQEIEEILGLYFKEGDD